MQDIHAWEVSKEDTMSDHRRINFLLEQDKPASRYYRNPRRTNWEVFDKELSQSIGLWIGRVKTPADIERELTGVNSALINAYEKACPLRKVSGRHRVPWWKNELKKLKIKANRAFHITYKSGSKEDWNKHRKDRRTLKKLVRRCKRECWQNFCYNVEGTHESSRLNRILGNTATGKLGMPNGEWTESSEEVIQNSYRRIFLDAWWSLKTPAPWIAYLSVQDGLTDSVLQLGNCKSLITEDRIKWAYESMAPYKSPGEEGILPVLVQHGMQYAATPICKLYRASLATGYIPLSWRIARSPFIPKPGRLDYTNSKTFRPINLTFFLLKGLEKLVDRYLRSVTLVDFPLNSRQHAYQASKSTESALHQLVERVERALKLNNTPSVYSLTLKGHLIILPPERSGKLWRTEKLFDLS